MLDRFLKCFNWLTGLRRPEPLELPEPPLQPKRLPVVKFADFEDWYREHFHEYMSLPDGALECDTCDGTGEVVQECGACGVEGPVECEECDGTGQMLPKALAFEDYWAERRRETQALKELKIRFE